MSELRFSEDEIIEMKRKSEREIQYIISTCKANRENKGLSIEDVAKITNLRPSRIRKFEETGNLPLDEALKIADVVCDDLFGLLKDADQYARAK